jgi:16S rRNA (cytidine1402-2'-O)-methyltransferase
VFGGFLPARPVAARRAALERLAASAGAVGLPMILFEAPHRVSRLLAELGALTDAHPALRVAAGRELTKLHEEMVVGTPAEVADALAVLRGEFTLVISGLEAPAPDAGPDQGAITAAARRAGLSARATADLLRAAGVPRREAYRSAQAAGKAPVSRR